MTVGELKKLLANYDDNLEVVYQGRYAQDEINSAHVGYARFIFDDGDHYYTNGPPLDGEAYLMALVLTSETIDVRNVDET